MYFTNFSTPSWADPAQLGQVYGHSDLYLGTCKRHLLVGGIEEVLLFANISALLMEQTHFM